MVRYKIIRIFIPLELIFLSSKMMMLLNISQSITNYNFYALKKSQHALILNVSFRMERKELESSDEVFNPSIHCALCAILDNKSDLTKTGQYHLLTVVLIYDVVLGDC